MVELPLQLVEGLLLTLILGIHGATTAAVSSLAAGTYTVTITDANGCTNSNSTTVTQPAALVAASSVSSAISGNGLSDGQITASATGGTTPYTYAWNDGQTTATATGLSAGTYTVTLSDANGCTDTSSTTLSGPAALIASASTSSHVSCNGLADGAATASASGGSGAYTYAWSNAATTASISSLAAGTYTVTITDNNGITDTASTVVTQPNALVAATVANSNASCNGSSDAGATASATGGTTPYTYSWNTGATTAAVSSLSAGTYTVTVTDNNGCSNNASVTLTQPTAVNSFCCCNIGSSL